MKDLEIVSFDEVKKSKEISREIRCSPGMSIYRTSRIKECSLRLI